MRRLIVLLTVFSLFLALDVCGIRQIQSNLSGSKSNCHSQAAKQGNCCDQKIPAQENPSCCISIAFVREGTVFSADKPILVQDAIKIADNFTDVTPDFERGAGPPGLIAEHSPQTLFLSNIFSHAPPRF